MNFLNIFGKNLISIPMLCFYLGIMLGIINKKILIPPKISKLFSIYLIISIGVKGGIAFTTSLYHKHEMFILIVVSLLVSFFQPFISFNILKNTTKIDKNTAAAVAAHYGSISLNTFIAGVNFLSIVSIKYSSYIIAVLSFMEIPSIISSLYILNINNNNPKYNIRQFLNVIKRILLNKTLLLLITSFLIGILLNNNIYKHISLEHLFNNIFYVILSLFLLDIGILITKKFYDLKFFDLKLIMFGIYMPIINALIGLIISFIIGLDVGTGFLFVILNSSASYIVVTSIMKSVLPNAKIAIYVPMSLAITFPFNMIFGLPLYFLLCKSFL